MGREENEHVGRGNTWHLMLSTYFPVLFTFFFFLIFLGPHPHHVEVPWLGGEIRAAASGLCHSQSNAGSETCLGPAL